MKSIEALTDSAIALLKQLITTPSMSKEEGNTAVLIEDHFQAHSITPNRLMNNIWCLNKHYDPDKKTILLNSHHDTVKPNNGYTKDPFTPIVEDGKLYGLGSNDAGGCLVSLIATFIHYYEQENLNYNLAIACTAEEEITGKNGIAITFPELPEISAAIIGEPTQMQMAIAEKGLLVLECTTKGISGHSARDEGENAIYKALPDINWFKNFKFDKVSESLGPVKMTVTVIESGTQHNVVPDLCSFTVDVRTTDAYSNQETFDIIKENVSSEVKPRSLRLNPSSIDESHALVQSGKSLGLSTYGSPTLSDQSLINVQSLKIGPGDSARSHTADEYVHLHEIEEGIKTYIELLNNVLI